MNTDTPAPTKPPLTVPETIAQHPAWIRLEDQLARYDGKSVRCQFWYKKLKLVQILLAVAIPVFSRVQEPYGAWLTAIAGAAIAVLEGMQHLNQYSTLWLRYRTTAEQLQREKFLLLSGAGHYKGSGVEERLVLLSERVEEMILSEHSNWIEEIGRRTAEKPSSGQSV
jgi:hypothetical protein